jgi:RUN domain
LDRFGTILEQVLLHGFIANKSGLFPQKREYWDFIQTLEGLDSTTPDLFGIKNLLDNVRNLEGCKSAKGKGRAWIRMTLMQKSFAHYWEILVDSEVNRNNLMEFYEPWALIRSELMTAISGMILGLNSLEFNLCLKGEDLEGKASEIDWSSLIREGYYLGCIT